MYTIYISTQVTITINTSNGIGKKERKKKKKKGGGDKVVVVVLVVVVGLRLLFSY